MLYEYGWLEPHSSVYVADIRLAVSRDGERFQRVQPISNLYGEAAR